MTTLQIPLRIFRYKPGQPPRYDTFTVELSETAHVLDALETVWALRDRSLTFRHACHHASCGACGLRVDGLERLPCVTRVTDVWDGRNPLCIEPLRNFPIVSDLVVDVSGLYQRLSASTMSPTREAETVLPLTVGHRDTKPEQRPIEPADNLHFNRFADCIECGLCMSACPTMATDDRFFGPLGLAALYQAREQTDDAAEKERLLALADGEEGVWRCHSAFECAEVCPQSLSPAAMIMALRHDLVVSRSKKLFRG